MPCYKQSGAFQRRAAVNHPLRLPFARGHVDLPLSKPDLTGNFPRDSELFRPSLEHWCIFILIAYCRMERQGG
jgi:hypothetical protein